MFRNSLAVCSIVVLLCLLFLLTIINFQLNKLSRLDDSAKAGFESWKGNASESAYRLRSILAKLEESDEAKRIAWREIGNASIRVNELNDLFHLFTSVDIESIRLFQIHSSKTESSARELIEAIELCRVSSETFNREVYGDLRGEICAIERFSSEAHKGRTRYNETSREYNRERQTILGLMASWFASDLEERKPLAGE